MTNKSTKNLSSTTKTKPVQPIVNIGPHMLSILDKRLVEKLKINEGDCCEQYITEEGDILLKIKKILAQSEKNEKTISNR
jgi:hypothetical protein